MTDCLILKAPLAPNGHITVHEGDGILGNFLRVGYHPYCEGVAPTVMVTSGRFSWVVVRK